MSMYFVTFVVGGIICVIGQMMLDLTKLTAPRVLVIFVVTGVILQALNLYEPIVNIAGSGATVPLPGFGHILAKGAMEGAKEGFLGAIKGVFENTSVGIITAIVFGYIVAIVSNPKSMR